MTDQSNGGPSSANELRSRRGMLAAMGAGGAAAAAMLASRDPAWAGHDSTNTMHLGVLNQAAAETQLTADVAGPALQIGNAQGESLHCDGPVGMFTDAEGGAALTVGNFHSAGDGIAAAAHGQFAVEGVQLTDSGPGSAGVIGVSGEGEDYGEGPGTGVLGAAGTGIGVAGFSPTTGIAVNGRSEMGIGVHASTDGGTALSVDGPAAFATAGTGTVPEGDSSVFVEHDKVTDQSHISVTLASDPGDRQVSWVERSAGPGFTVHMTSASHKKRPETEFTYLVVEPV